MIVNKDTPDESGREGYAFYLLECSGYGDVWRDEIERRINEGYNIEVIITDLLMNRVDSWNSYRLKDINRRLDEKCL